MVKKITLLGIFSSLAIIIGYIERLIPLPLPVPGIKLGLANVIILIVLYYMGEKEAFLILIVKILATGFLFGNSSAIIYSLTGGMASFAAMAIGKRLEFFSIAGVSVIGGVFHNAAQILIASAVVNNILLLYYLPVLVLAGVVSGLITGMIGSYTLSQLKKIGKRF